MNYKLFPLMIPKRLLAAFLAILPLADPVELQAADKKSTDSQPVEFSCVAWEILPFPELFYRNGKKYLPIKLSAGQRSPACRLQDAHALELFVRKEKAAGGSKSASSDSYKLAGLAPLREGTGRMLFLIEPTKESDKNSNGLPLQLRGMDDSLETFPAGSFRFINLTPDLLRIEFGGATHDLPEGGEQVLSPDFSAAGGFLPVIIKNEEGRIVLENRFFAQLTGRELVIISPPTEGRKELKVKFLSDAIPASPAPVNKTTPRK
jgi:hypothetical protein